MEYSWGERPSAFDNQGKQRPPEKVPKLVGDNDTGEGTLEACPKGDHAQEGYSKVFQQEIA